MRDTVAELERTARQRSWRADDGRPDARAVESQTADAVLMVRPARFGSNPETAGSNFFQRSATGTGDAALRAQHEFDGLALALANAGVRVHQFAGQAAALPDEVFPNNWLSLALRRHRRAVSDAGAEPPARTPARHSRSARRPCGYRIDRIVDLTRLEDRGEYLEGTGSLVLDRERHVAYACRSPRTHQAHSRNSGGISATRSCRSRPSMARVGRSITPTSCSRSARVSPRCARGDRGPRSGASSSRGSRLAAASSSTSRTDELESFAGNLLELAGVRAPDRIVGRGVALPCRADAARARAARPARLGRRRDDRAHRRRQRALHAGRGGVAAAASPPAPDGTRRPRFPGSSARPCARASHRGSCGRSP